MYTTDVKDKFIELAAAGLPAARIAQELNIDPKTVYRWKQQFGARIHNLRQLQLEELQQRLLGSCQQRFAALVEDDQRYHNELKARNPNNIPQRALFHITWRLRQELEKQIVVPKFIPEPPEPQEPQKSQ